MKGGKTIQMNFISGAHHGVARSGRADAGDRIFQYLPDS